MFSTLTFGFWFGVSAEAQYYSIVWYVRCGSDLRLVIRNTTLLDLSVVLCTIQVCDSKVDHRSGGDKICLYLASPRVVGTPKAKMAVEKAGEAIIRASTQS